MQMTFRCVSILFLVLALTGMSACSKSETITRVIAGHEFRIPREYVVEATVFYLPASQERALRFVLDPTLPLSLRNMVSIYPDAKCPSIDSKVRDDFCRIIPVPLSKLQQEQLKRVGDASLWEYRFANSGEPMAYCSALGQGDGLCTHYGLYKGLPYELSLRDSQMPDVVVLRRTAEQLLAEWEVN